MSVVTRRPSLDDYDNNTAFLYFAERIAAKAGPQYGESALTVDSHHGRLATPHIDTPSDSAAKADAAKEQYRVYLEKALAAQRLGAEIAEREREDRARLLAERRRIEREHIEARRREQIEADKLRDRWLAEQREWAESEERRRVERIAQNVALAKAISEWGSGVVIIINQTFTVRWNGHPSEGKIQLNPEDVLNIGYPLATKIEAAGFGHILSVES